jgi:hypothetical protein
MAPRHADGQLQVLVSTRSVYLLNRLLKMSPGHVATDWLRVRQPDTLGKSEGRPELLSGEIALGRVCQQPVNAGFGFETTCAGMSHVGRGRVRDLTRKVVVTGFR